MALDFIIVTLPGDISQQDVTKLSLAATAPVRQYTRVLTEQQQIFAALDVSLRRIELYFLHFCNKNDV